MRAWLLVALFAFPAFAEPGFFRDPGDRVLERNVLKTDFQCSVKVAYNTLHPAWVELSGLTIGCVPTTHQALLNASLQSKVFVLGEPAHDPNYECVVQVYWNDPTAPTITLAGGTSCPHFQGQALAAAAQMTL